MIITINDKFKIKVPRFTDEFKDLVQLYKENFGGWKFENEDYESLSMVIINSDNSNWDKAIALVILNEKLLAKTIFAVNEDGVRPLSRFQHKITYIVESLAVRGIDAFLKQQATTGYQFGSYIVNAVQFSINVERYDGRLLKMPSARKTLLKQQFNVKRKNKWYDLVAEYRRKYGEVKLSRMTILKARVKNLEEIKADSNKKIQILKEKMEQLHILQNECKVESSNYIYSSYPKMVFKIETCKTKAELEKITEKCDFVDFKRIFYLLQKDIDEYMDEAKLAKNLEQLKDEYRLLSEINNIMNELNGTKPTYLIAEKVETLDPVDLTNEIDLHSYYNSSQEIYLDFAQFHQSIYDALREVQKKHPREERVIELRYLIPNPDRSLTGNKNELKDGVQRTLEEIGKEFSTSRERIRQMLAKGMRILRHPSYSNDLREFVNDVPFVEDIVDDDNRLPCNWYDGQ